MANIPAIISVHVHEGFAASVSAEYAAFKFREAIEAARRDKDPKAAVKAVLVDYFTGAIAAQWAKKTFVARPGVKQLICPKDAFVKACEILQLSTAARETQGFMPMVTNAKKAMQRLRDAAGIASDGSDVPAEGDDNHSGGKKAKGKRGTKARKGKDKPETERDLETYVTTHKPETYDSAEMLALTIGRAFGFWAKGNPKMFDGNPRAAALREAMLAFNKAIIDLPKLEG